MSNVFHDNFIEQEKMTARTMFLDQLAGYVFVDMGVISNATQTETGYRCNVNTFRLTVNQDTIYDNVELLMIGNGQGGIHIDPVGSDCLVFGPYSSATAIGEGTILGINKPYDMSYMKCIPVSNPAFWQGTLFFDAIGSVSYKTGISSICFGVDGSFTFDNYVMGQHIVVEPDGDIIAQSKNYKRVHKPDGTEYRYVVGVEPGSISLFESYQDNIKDTFWDTIENFAPQDSEDDEWKQLLDHNSWHKHVQEDRNTGITLTELYDDDGKLLSHEEINPDGSRLLVNTDPGGVVLFSRLIDADGSLVIEIGDKSYTLEIKADGKVTEYRKGNVSMSTDGTMTLKSKGAMTIQTDNALTLEATASGMVKLGNSINTLGKFLDTIYTNLTSLHTEGSPAAHTGSAWASSWVPIEQAKLGMVFS